MIKDKYKNIPDNEFVPVTDGIKKEHIGFLKVNKNGEVLALDIKTKKWKNINVHFSKIYPYISIHYGSQHLQYYLHVLLASTFLINDDPRVKTQIDHIDRNKNNYSLNNLRWTTISDNNKNRKIDKLKYRYVGISDDGKNIVEYSEDSGFNLRKIQSNLKKAYGFEWTKVNTEVDNYLNHLGLLIKDLVFVQTLDPKVFVCKEGLFKTKQGLTLGTNSPDGRRKITICGKTKLVSRVVYETFSGEKLNNNDVVDHIDTNPQNNHISNLRKTDHKGNMNNSLTVQKLQIPIVQLSLEGNYIKTFKSLDHAFQELNRIKGGCISDVCRGGTHKTAYGYKWMYEEDYLKLKENENNSDI